MMKNTYDDKDDTAYAGTMKRSKSNQKEGGISRDKKRSETDVQRKSGGRDRGGTKPEKTSTQKRMVPATSANASPVRAPHNKKTKAVNLLHPFAQPAEAAPKSPNRFAPLQSDADDSKMQIDGGSSADPVVHDDMSSTQFPTSSCRTRIKTRRSPLFPRPLRGFVKGLGALRMLPLDSSAKSTQ